MMECAHGHTRRSVGCVSCVLVFDNPSMAKRGYSREFTPRTERRVRFEIDRIPPTLMEAVKAKAKREGVSLRTLTLRLWRDWADGTTTRTEG